MSTGMPELGSKISLISKADIRYEGRLFTVDPAECTIALANVRSYGTEDRETQFPISPQNQVYDYILFRGSDIKDIRVVNNVQIPNDPAIMQMQLPAQQMVNQQPFQPQQFPVPVMGHMGAQMGQFGGTYNAIAGLGGLTGQSLAPGSNMANTGGVAGGLVGGVVGAGGGGGGGGVGGGGGGGIGGIGGIIGGGSGSGGIGGGGVINNNNNAALHKTKQASELNIAIPEPHSSATTSQAEHKDQASVLDLIGGGSRSTTPISLHSRKSPTTDMGVQVNKSGTNSNKDGSRRNNLNRGQRDRRDSGNQNQMMMGHDTNHRNQQQQHRNNNNNNHQQNQQYHGNNQNRGWNNHRGNQQQPHHQQQQQGGGLGITNGGGGGGGNMRGQRPRGRGPPMQQAFRQNIHNQNSKGGRGGKTTIKFDSDYDFEQANSKFEELRLGLAKAKVGEEANKPEQLNGGETDKKDDSGNETGAGEHEQEEDEVTVGYDKTKSFFDNISCEAAQDRTSGKNRSDWRHERKINSETFGASARRGGFYSFRGRGGYYNNRNMNNMGGGGGGGGGGYRSGGYHRGGGSGNFRGGRNFNNRNYSHHQSSGTGIPQQPNSYNNKQDQQQQHQSNSEISETTATATGPGGSVQQQTSSAGAASTTTPVPATKSTVVTSSPAASATTPSGGSSAASSSLPASLPAPIAAGN